MIVIGQSVFDTVFHIILALDMNLLSYVKDTLWCNQNVNDIF